MKLSIMMFPFHNAMSQGLLAPAELVAHLQDAGATAIEPMWSWISKDPATWQKLHQATTNAGLAYACYDVGINLVGENHQDRIKAIDNCKQQIDFARDTLHCPCMMIHGSKPAKEMSNDDGRKIYGEMLAQAASAANGSGVTICIEDFGVYPLFTASAKHCREVLAIAGPEVKFTFDNGNFLLGGDCPTEVYDSLKDRICHVHIKDMTALPPNQTGGFSAPDGTAYRGCFLGKGDAQVTECLAMLKKDNYAGWLSAEINSSQLDEAIHALHFIADAWQ